MRKKLDNLVKKIKNSVKKYINSNNVIWTKEAMLKLIYIEKRNVAKQKSVKENGDRKQPTLYAAKK